MEKMNKNIVGVCPICKKGHIVERERRYTCDNTSKDNPCGFYIHKEIKRTQITPEIVQQLISQGKTDVMRFTNSNGDPFRARLALNGKAIAILFDNEYLKGKCPICGGRVQVTQNGYNCENRLKREGHRCTFHINKRLCNRELTKEEVENFLNGEVEILDKFYSSAGNEYAAYLELSEAGYVRTNSKISVCPKCGGTILVGSKGFNCSNYRMEGCKMRIPRKVAGHNLTFNDVKQLCERENHTTDDVEIKQANGQVIKRKLTFDESWDTITI